MMTVRKLFEYLALYHNTQALVSAISHANAILGNLGTRTEPIGYFHRFNDMVITEVMTVEVYIDTVSHGKWYDISITPCEDNPDTGSVMTITQKDESTTSGYYSEYHLDDKTTFESRDERLDKLLLCLDKSDTNGIVNKGQRRQWTALP